jgi:hypothetical protein
LGRLPLRARHFLTYFSISVNTIAKLEPSHST